MGVEVNIKNKKTKITQVFRFAYPHIGGIETVMNQINSCLPNEEFDKEVLCCSNTDKSSFENGVKYTRAKYLFEFASNNISPQLIWNLSKVKTDILHMHMPFIFGMIAFFIARPKYKKLYVTYHSDIIGFDKYMKYLWWLYRIFLRKADKIHVLSPNIIHNSQMLEEFADKCVVIPQGISLDYKVDNDKVNEIRNKYKDKKILFSLGRHVKYKGFIYGLEAMKNVGNAVWLLAGSGPLTDSFRQYIEENNLQEKVVLVGRLPDEELDNYYEACDIYLFPSVTRVEAFGIVQIEAMRHFKPVINTWLHNGVNYVSLDKETGLTVEPENVEQLTNAINELINNDELRLQYGINAKKRVQQLFDIKKLEKQYLEFYSNGK